jgi:alanyl-tRNA synthetase
VVADHLRAITFSIADGQLPSNNKAGYVIRRILRRAVRYGFTYLEQKEPFIHRLVPVLVSTMGDTFPELNAQQDLISRVIREEEASFLVTLETGMRLLDQLVKTARKGNYRVIPGRDAFVLYDTYGFPLDLTELILSEHGMEVDRGEFEVEMEAQKSRS